MDGDEATVEAELAKAASGGTLAYAMHIVAKSPGYVALSMGNPTPGGKKERHWIRIHPQHGFYFKGTPRCRPTAGSATPCPIRLGYHHCRCRCC